MQQFLLLPIPNKPYGFRRCKATLNLLLQFLILLVTHQHFKATKTCSGFSYVDSSLLMTRRERWLMTKFDPFSTRPDLVNGITDTDFWA